MAPKTVDNLSAVFICVSVVFNERSVANAILWPHIVICGVSNELVHFHHVFVSKDGFAIVIFALPNDVDVIRRISHFSKLPGNF
jgi:hypothetical protein